MTHPTLSVARGRLTVFLTSLVLLSAISFGEPAMKFHEDYRVWKDHSGQFEVNATLVAYENRELTLQTEAKRSIQVSIDKICKRDQAYTVKLLRSMRDKPRRQHFSLQNQFPSPQDKIQAREKKLLDDSDVPTMDRAEELYGVTWEPIELAETYAGLQDKPVMWFRVLGDMKGFM